MFIETERLILRKFKEKDFEDFCEFTMDEEMCRMMGRDLITDAESARPTFEWLMNKEERGYVLEYKEKRAVLFPFPYHISINAVDLCMRR